MPYEWLLIALPIIFALGWFAARMDIRHIRKSLAALPAAYLQGLRELLRGNEEKALETFSAISEEETLPPELLFTTGELSRRRGDYRRALRVHQQLYANEKLSDAARNRALWELANDCAAMGFVDTAEQHARLLAHAPDYGERVFNFLLKNYQMRRRYDEALALIKNAPDDTRQMHRALAAQLCCQIAETAPARAAALLQEALAQNPRCARARLLLAERALGASPPHSAAVLEQIHLIEKEATDVLWLAADSYFRALLCDSKGEGEEEKAAAALENWLARYPSPQMLKTVIAVFEKHLPQQRARLNALVGEFLVRHNSLPAAAYWVCQKTAAGETRQWLALQKTLLGAEQKAFACGACSYEMNYFVWQCPGCLNWEQFRQNA